MKCIFAILSVLVALPALSQANLTIPGKGKNIFLSGSYWEVLYKETEIEHSAFNGIGRYSPLSTPSNEIVDGTFFDKYLSCLKINGNVTTDATSSSASVTCNNYIADTARFSSHTSLEAPLTHMELEVTCINKKPVVTKAYKYMEPITIVHSGESPITITPTGADNEVHHLEFTNDPAVDITITFNEIIEIKNGNKIDVQKNAINFKTNDLSHLAAHTRIQAECNK